MEEAKETIYVNNLNDRVSLHKLKKELARLFDKYGEIIQITAHKNFKMKGQAFITYSDKNSSKEAVDGLQHTELFGKNMKLAYAHKNSDSYFTELEHNDEPVALRKQHKQEVNKEQGSKTNPAKILQSWKSIPPNLVLLLHNINSDVDQDQLIEYFEQWNGFARVRYVKVRNIAFIEFEEVSFATSCMESIDRDSLKRFGSDVVLTYAKK